MPLDRCSSASAPNPARKDRHGQIENPREDGQQAPDEIGDAETTAGRHRPNPPKSAVNKASATRAASARRKSRSPMYQRHRRRRSPPNRRRGDGCGATNAGRLAGVGAGAAITWEPNGPRTVIGGGQTPPGHWAEQSRAKRTTACMDERSDEKAWRLILESIKQAEIRRDACLRRPAALAPWSDHPVASEPAEADRSRRRCIGTRTSTAGNTPADRRRP